MTYEIVKLAEKTVAGLTARTNNASPDMGIIIGSLWQRYFGGGIYPAISGKINDKTLGIYTDYESDETGDYTIMVACETSETRQADDITVRVIPAGCYAKFIVRGNQQQAVAAFWMELWQMDLPRTFVCDFEEYQNNQVEDAEIHIYIGMKEGLA